MLKAGQVIPLKFKDREFRAVIIDPDGFGYNRPTIGVGYRSMSRHTDVPVNTIIQRVVDIAPEEGDPNTGGKFLKLPSGRLFRVIQILGNDGNEYSVIEVADWVDIVSDWAKNPGKLRIKS